VYRDPQSFPQLSRHLRGWPSPITRFHVLHSLPHLDDTRRQVLWQGMLGSPFDKEFLRCQRRVALAEPRAKKLMEFLQLIRQRSTHELTPFKQPKMIV
jgi:hypothetical protein